MYKHQPGFGRSIHISYCQNSSGEMSEFHDCTEGQALRDTGVPTVNKMHTYRLLAHRITNIYQHTAAPIINQPQQKQTSYNSTHYLATTTKDTSYLTCKQFLPCGHWFCVRKWDTRLCEMYLMLDCPESPTDTNWQDSFLQCSKGLCLYLLALPEPLPQRLNPICNIYL